MLIGQPDLDITRLSGIIINPSRPDVLPIRLDQVAELKLGPAPQERITRIDGQSVVALDLERTRGTHMITVAENVHDRIESITEYTTRGHATHCNG